MQFFKQGPYVAGRDSVQYVKGAELSPMADGDYVWWRSKVTNISQILRGGVSFKNSSNSIVYEILSSQSDFILFKMDIRYRTDLVSYRKPPKLPEGRIMEVRSCEVDFKSLSISKNWEVILVPEEVLNNYIGRLSDAATPQTIFNRAVHKGIRNGHDYSILLTLWLEKKIVANDLMGKFVIDDLQDNWTKGVGEEIKRFFDAIIQGRGIRMTGTTDLATKIRDKIFEVCRILGKTLLVVASISIASLMLALDPTATLSLSIVIKMVDIMLEEFFERFSVNFDKVSKYIYMINY
jgi:hypothetical protein